MEAAAVDVELGRAIDGRRRLDPVGEEGVGGDDLERRPGRVGAADGAVEGVGGVASELLFDDGECVFAGVVGNPEEFCGLGGVAADTDLREAGGCGAAQ